MSSSPAALTDLAPTFEHLYPLAVWAGCWGRLGLLGIGGLLLLPLLGWWAHGLVAPYHGVVSAQA